MPNKRPAGENLPAFDLIGFRGLALGNRNVVALAGARIELARTADALLRIFDHFVPLCDPADGAGKSEENGEHGRGKPSAFSVMPE